MSPANEPLLEAQALTKHFGGTAALKAVSFSAAAGEILGLIGPNGAGKTTLLNLLSGVLRPSSGKVLFRGQDLSGLKTHAVARMGIARTLQTPRSFPSMTVLENVAVGSLFGSPPDKKQNPVQMLKLVGLGARADSPMASLNLQERKNVELARALAMAPRVVLIDEAMSGLNPTEIEDSMRLIRRVRDETGVAIIWVEHVVKAIMQVVERIVVLNFGEVIADGSPAEIARNGAVIEAYLGEGRLMLVRVEGLHAGYGQTPVLRDVNIEAHPGEAIAVIGPNGAGKTTLLKTIMGMLRPTRGKVHYDGRHLNGLRAFQVARLGLAYVPAERELFPGMTVLENLELGAFRCKEQTHFERVFALFPRLAERRRQLAGTMSGGEQQMLAIGRALMGGPKVLMLDEPSTGLAPKAVAELYQQLSKLKCAGLTIVLTEQQVPLALALTDRAYVLEQGAIRLSGRSCELAGDPSIKKAYLGVA